MESKDRHKTVQCKFCKKIMRSDKLKRHMKTHKSFFTMADEEIKEKLRAQRESQLQIKERLQQIENIAQSMGMSADFDSDDDYSFIHSENDSLKLELLKNNRDYLKKVKMGKQIADILDE